MQEMTESSWLPAQSPKVSLQLWGIQLWLITLEYLTDHFGSYLLTLPAYSGNIIFLLSSLMD